MAQAVGTVVLKSTGMEASCWLKSGVRVNSHHIWTPSIRTLRNRTSTENWSKVSKFSGMCDQICVIEVPNISTQKSVEAVINLSRRSEFSERMCEQIGVVGVPKISSRERVEAVIFCFSRERISDRKCEQIGVVEVLQISSQDSVEALEIVSQEPISETMCEQIGVIEVSKISSQESVEAVENYPSGAKF